MPHSFYVQQSSTALVDLVLGLDSSHLDAPTPCADFDVQALINHLLLWGPVLEAAATKQDPPPQQAEPAEQDWCADLVASTRRVADAWARPQAWEGSTRMGGAPEEVSARVIGGMVIGEFVVHGWDLAMATGGHLRTDDEVLAYLLADLEPNADYARQIGVYGPEVDVAASAPLLHHVLGLTGRDPAWTPPR